MSSGRDKNSIDFSTQAKVCQIGSNLPSPRPCTCTNMPVRGSTMGSANPHGARFAQANKLLKKALTKYRVPNSISDVHYNHSEGKHNMPLWYDYYNIKFDRRKQQRIAKKVPGKNVLLRRRLAICMYMHVELDHGKIVSTNLSPNLIIKNDC
jgi:hypothetical protein